MVGTQVSTTKVKRSGENIWLEEPIAENKEHVVLKEHLRRNGISHEKYTTINEVNNIL